MFYHHWGAAKRKSSNPTRRKNMLENSGGKLFISYTEKREVRFAGREEAGVTDGTLHEGWCPRERKSESLTA